MSRFILLLILVIDVSILLYQVPTLSISSREANILYGDFSFLQLLLELSISIFANSDYGLRVPIIALHVGSVLLLYNISKEYLKDGRNRIWLVVTFILLPGVFSSALIVANASLTLFSLLLFVNLHRYSNKKFSYALLIILLFIDSSFAYLYIAMIFFAYHTKEKKLLLLSSILFLASLYLYGTQTGGYPKGYLLDTIGLYSAIFTPTIFIYIFYILYKRYFTKEMDILWYISAVALIYSMLISIRQDITMDDFAPYVVIALPLAGESFYSSYRVRLKIFRGYYKAIFKVSFAFLVLNFLLVLFSKELYLFIDKPKNNFAHKLHVAKELAEELRSMEITCIDAPSKMQKRLKFYNISHCEDYTLIKKSIDDINSSDVTISYKSRVIYRSFVTKINNP